MQVNNNPTISNTSNLNFKAIKSVKCKGLYKKFPQYGKELVDSFKANKKAMNFCKDYDTDIIFHATKDSMDDAIISSIYLSFKNPAKKKFLGIFGSTKDQILLSTWGKSYNNIEDAIKRSTNYLIGYINGTTGVLDSHITQKIQDIQKVLSKNNNETIAKKANYIKKQNAQAKFEKDTLDLNKTIEDLVNNQ